MSHIHKAILRGYKAPAKHHHNEALPDFSIRLHESGSIIHGLTVDAGYGGPRDLTGYPNDQKKGSIGVLTEPGRVDFITAKGKRFSPKFNEFSWVFNWRKPVIEPKPAPEPVKEAA